MNRFSFLAMLGALPFVKAPVAPKPPLMGFSLVEMLCERKALEDRIEVWEIWMRDNPGEYKRIIGSMGA